MGKFKVGNYIEERYKIKKFLSKKKVQKASLVLLCWDREKEKEVVLKTYKPKYKDDPEVVDLFKQKALKWILLKNTSHISEVVSLRYLEKQYFIIFKYISPDKQQRNTLKQHIQKVLPKKLILKWCLELCEGMINARKRGILAHRDIKPSNIMIDSTKTLMISDFGIAQVRKKILTDLLNYERENSDDKKISFLIQKRREDIIVGSPSWMAPETFEAHYSVRSDIFSFGVVMYQMLNQGALPFSKQTVRGYHLQMDSAQENQIQKHLYPIIKKCLQKKPEKRYNSFKELREELKTICERKLRTHPPPPQKKPEITFKQLFQYGISYHTLGLFTKALDYYKECLARSSQQVDPYRKITELFLDLGEPQNALKYLRKGLKKFPADLTLTFLYSKLLIKQQKFKEATTKLKQILNIKPQHIDAYNLLGKAYYMDGQFKNALTTFQTLIEEAPSIHNNVKEQAKIFITKIKNKNKMKK